MGNETTVTDIDTPSKDANAVAASAAKSAGRTQAEKTKAMVIGRTGGKRYDIKIASTESDTSPVKIGVNGEMTLIPRNVSVNIGEDVMEAINNSVVTVYAKTDSGLQASQAPRFSVSVLGVTEDKA